MERNISKILFPALRRVLGNKEVFRKMSLHSLAKA